MALNNPHKTARPLQVGYIWQYESTKASPFSATALHVQAVVRGLERRGHRVRMVAVRNGRPHWSDDLQTWHPVDLPAAPWSLRLLERAVRAVQARLGLPYLRFFDSQRFSQACASALAGCDVLYERFWLMAYGGLLASRKLKAPLVYEVNGDLVEEYAQLDIKLNRSQWTAIHFITRQMFQRAGRVVTVSETLRRRTIDRWKIDPSQVCAVSNGADVNLFASASQSSADPAQMRSRYGLNGDALVMFVGSFKPWHGLDLLVDAFKLLAAQDPEVKLVFVGDGPVRSQLEDQARQLELGSRVVFTGAVPHQDVARLLSAAQVAVLNPKLSPASLSQSPLKLFEYMAAGKAIVAPAIPNVQQVLTDRVNALLVPPDQPEALAGALAELLADDRLRQALGQAARQQALEQHSWDETVSRLEAIFYEELAG